MEELRMGTNMKRKQEGLEEDGGKDGRGKGWKR